MRLSYSDLLTLSENYLSRSVYLSGFSFALLISWIAETSSRWRWLDMPNSQWDQVDALVSKCIEELQMSADIGVVVPLMTNVIPERYLLCDGGVYNREDYPLLYAVLPSSLIINADEFTLPDMSGQTVVGATVLRPLLTQFGEETHTLTENEIPVHAHSYAPPAAAISLEGAGAPVPTATISVTPALTGTAGGGQAHNNLQPSISLYWCVVAR